MAVFRPQKRVCTLNFDDKFTYEIPLSDDFAFRLDDAKESLNRVAPTDRAGIDAAYNTALDIIDELLGAGASDDIMSLFDNPGSVEVMEVFLYIVEEWKNAYTAVVENASKTIPAPNRAERRARR